MKTVNPDNVEINISDPVVYQQYQELYRSWKNCQKCPLAKKRRRIAMFRGTMPCDVLFVGEAPGESEDMIGRPFVGPSGKLLDDIILTVQEEMDLEFTYGIANIVACWPYEVTNNIKTTRMPHKDEASVCRPRLENLISLCKPQMIVSVGNVARQRMPRPLPQGTRECSILHPASILRRDSTSAQHLDFRRCVTTLNRHLEAIR